MKYEVNGGMCIFFINYKVGWTFGFKEAGGVYLKPGLQGRLVEKDGL